MAPSRFQSFAIHWKRNTAPWVQGKRPLVKTEPAHQTSTPERLAPEPSMTEHDDSGLDKADKTNKTAHAANAAHAKKCDVPIDPFAGVPASLATAIRRRGFAELTSVQRAVLDTQSEGRDLRISSQTGSGKTVAIGFVLASDLAGVSGRDSATARRGQRGPIVLVLVPTRELAMQVRDELSWLFEATPHLGFEVVMGGTPIGLERRALAKKPQVVVATPGRALDHLKRGALSLAEVRHVVLDESDRMLDMGFREELEAILDAMPAERRTHLVSATFPASVRKLADRFQRDALHVAGTALGAANRDIEHIAHVVSRRESYGAIVNLLLLNEGKRCLIFVERRVDATTLAEKLASDGFGVQAFSGELSQAQRTRNINAFRKGTLKTLVSTDVAARGIDVPNIELVIHADTPESADAYVHRSGRTGRAGSTGRSVMLVAPSARRYYERVLKAARIQANWQPVLTASKVERELRKRFRRAVHDRLEEEGEPTQQQVDYAKGLLDGRDPAAVVALLLEMAQPKPARNAMDVRDASEVVESRLGQGQGQGHNSGGGRGADGDRQRRPHGKARPAGDRDATAYVTFSINWGGAKGAATSRVLGHVCRRGKIQSHQVGAIQIGAHECVFDVDATVAARFEKAVLAPDSRDPDLRIVRASGTAISVRSEGRGAGGQGAEGHQKHRPQRPAARGKKRFKAKGKARG